MEPTQIACPYCNLNIDSLSYFCPNCGKKVREKPLSVSISAQILLYSLSLFLPPFGLGLTIRYLKSKEEKSRTVGIVSLILTILALIIISFLTISMFQNLQKQLSNQLNQGMGF